MKKLREEAYQTYGIKSKLELVDGGYVIIVGMRHFNKDDIATHKVKDAKKVLHQMRNNYCVKRVSDIRDSRRISKYNRL